MKDFRTTKILPWNSDCENILHTGSCGTTGWLDTRCWRLLRQKKDIMKKIQSILQCFFTKLPIAIHDTKKNFQIYFNKSLYRLNRPTFIMLFTQLPVAIHDTKKNFQIYFNKSLHRLNRPTFTMLLLSSLLPFMTKNNFQIYFDKSLNRSLPMKGLKIVEA